MGSNLFAHSIQRFVPPSVGSARSAAFLIGFLFFLPGCAGPPYSTESLPTVPLVTSRDGRLRYAVPIGWFDATANAKAPRSAIWIVRNDYCASIAVNTMEVDAVTRGEIDRDGLFRIAQLSMQLNTNVRSAVVLQAPKVNRSSGRDYCVYEIEEPATRDRMRIVLFYTGEGVYEVTALQTGGDRPASEEVFSVQERFLARLQW